MTFEEAAEDAFVKAEHVRSLEMMNAPTDYDERKRAFIDLAKARRAAADALTRLDDYGLEARIQRLEDAVLELNPGLNWKR